MTCTTFTKDPEAVLDYIFDWSDWLASGETIQTASITVQSGITLASTINSTTAVVGWISGGTVNTTYRVECKIVTSAGRTDVRGIQIRVADRWC